MALPDLPIKGQNPWYDDRTAWDLAVENSLESLESAAPRILRPEMFGAVGDGIANDTAALTSMLAAVTTGDTIIGDTGKTYNFTEPLTMANASNVRWSGGHYRFTRSAASTSGGTIAIRGSNINYSVFENFYLEQVNQGPEYTGLSVGNSEGVKIQNVHVYNFRWVGVAVEASCFNVELINSIATQCRFGGFSTAPGTKFIGGRYSSEWSKTTEYVAKGGVWDVSSLYYDGIIIGGKNWAVIGATFDDNGQSGIYGSDASLGLVSGCIVTDNFNKGIDFGAVSPTDVIQKLTITGNVIKGNATGDISMAGAIECVISSNVIEVTKPTAGIGLRKTTNIFISGNQIHSTSSIPAVFAESVAPDACTRTYLGDNIIYATNPYSVDFSTSVVAFPEEDTYRIFGKLAVSQPLRSVWGTTAQRPSASGVGAGSEFYDSTLGKPIWSNGTVWRDAAGTVV